jgi:hypothetical protein
MVPNIRITSSSIEKEASNIIDHQNLSPSMVALPIATDRLMAGYACTRRPLLARILSFMYISVATHVAM